jgi:hypothetical protein
MIRWRASLESFCERCRKSIGIMEPSQAECDRGDRDRRYKVSSGAFLFISALVSSNGRKHVCRERDRERTYLCHFGGESNGLTAATREDPREFARIREPLILPLRVRTRTCSPNMKLSLHQGYVEM